MEEQDLAFKTNQGCFTYRVAAIIIKDNKLLMAKHEDYPCYYTVGGKVRINETSEEAVIREAYEETGIEFQIDRLSFIQERFFEMAGKHYHEIVFYFLMKENPKIDLSNRSFTDQGPKESLNWLPIEGLDETYIIPEFFKTKLLDNIVGIEHIVSKE
ncbi:NUDIX domain-containing protein [Clostridium sp. YIM B02515]|uniref:NUDIX domain-containing protein n=1 Tax=Clostridium rhizosphaerae TaxID=2803861 RepID=A0ABS1TEG8_9CLOT|nr:NUDIX domain-containing protein [Clostridium rhizosphaerae]